MADLNLLRSLGAVKQFPKDDIIFMENDAGASMYIVLKGVFGVYINSFSDFPVRVAGIQPGSFFGEMSVIDGWPRSATIVAEEEGAVIVIEKSNFATLLEKAPDITDSILYTLRNRVASTAKAVREAGKEAPELPPFINQGQGGDAKSSLLVMRMLAQKVRQMNDLLATAEESSAALAEAVPPSTVKLLPDGYVPFNLPDSNDNSNNLRMTKTICPYCGKESDAYIPLFSHLGETRAALDGRIRYDNIDILRYTNIICPNCNYTDTYQEFGKRRYACNPPEYEGNQFKNVENFAGYMKRQSHTLDEAILSYYLNLDCLARTTTEPLRFAKAWIRLYWLYSDQNSTALAKQAAEQARDYYVAHAEKNKASIAGVDKMRLNAILGELSVALHEYERALRYYAQNIDMGSSLKNDLLRESRKRYDEIKKL